MTHTPHIHGEEVLHFTADLPHMAAEISREIPIMGFGFFVVLLALKGILERAMEIDDEEILHLLKDIGIAAESEG